MRGKEEMILARGKQERNDMGFLALLPSLTLALSANWDFLLCRKRNSRSTEAAEATAERLALGRARTLLNSTWRANIT